MRDTVVLDFVDGVAVVTVIVVDRVSTLVVVLLLLSP